MSSSSSERSRRSSEGRQQKNGHVNGFEASQEFKHANGGRDGASAIKCCYAAIEC